MQKTTHTDYSSESSLEIATMTPQELAQLNDDQLIEVARQNKPSPLFDAFFIGLAFGIIIFGVATKGWWWFAIVPLFFIYQFPKKLKQNEGFGQELEKRGIKAADR